MITQKLAEVVIDIESDIITSGYVSAPFYEAQEALKRDGLRVISLAENAALRMQEGKEAFVSLNGNYAMEGSLYLPQEGKFLVRHSPLLYTAEATGAYGNTREFYLTDDQAKALKEGSIRVLDNITVPTDRFKDEELTAWAFRDYAERYGLFLREAGIEEMPVFLPGEDYVNNQENPFVRQLWFSNLELGSRLVAFDMFLNEYYRSVRGVIVSP